MREIIGVEMNRLWQGEISAIEATQRMAAQIQPLLESW
jgi:hypothetical protein